MNGVRLTCPHCPASFYVLDNDNPHTEHAQAETRLNRHINERHPQGGH